MLFLVVVVRAILCVASLRALLATPFSHAVRLLFSMATTPYSRVRFEDVWAAFMVDQPVREWLFNRTPLTKEEAWRCVTNRPEPLSFSFDGKAAPSNTASVQNLHDFALLSTVLYQARGVALGVTFGNGNRQPLLPVAFRFTADNDYADNHVVVRRCAIRRATPGSRHLLRLQCDWFRSGLLGVDYSFIPASDPDLRPSVGFAVFGHRFFKQSAAEQLHLASLAPTSSFLDGTSTLLSPEDGYVTLDGCDSQFQTPCMFCAYRNSVLCHCPAPLRRRVIDEDALYGDPITNAITIDGKSAEEVAELDASDGAVQEMVWHYFSHRMKISLSNGTFLTNWRYERPTTPGLSQVVEAHIVPYALMFNNTGSESPVIQRALTALGLAHKSPQLITQSGFYSEQQHHLNDDVLDDAIVVDNPPSYTQPNSNNAVPIDSSDSIPTIDVAASSPSPPDLQQQTLQSQSTVVTTLASTPNVNSMTQYTGGSNLIFEEHLLHLNVTLGQTSPIEDENPAPELVIPTKITIPRSVLGEVAKKSKKKTSNSNKNNAITNANSTTEKTKRVGVAKKETRKWQCDQCNAVIRGKRSNLTRHIQNKHAKVRAFECDSCGKRFQTRLNLVRHKTLVHEGRPHMCTHCERTFKTQEKLQKHLDTVHSPGVTPLACPLCGGCYGKRSTLSRHVTSVHRAMSDVSSAADPDADKESAVPNVQPDQPPPLATAQVQP